MAGRRTWHTRAIVLARTKLSEQDLILTMLDASGAQVRAVAKGARKPGGRLSARTELFGEVELLLAAGRGALAIVGEASVREAHAALRGDLDRVAAASAVAEVARRTCYEDAPDAYLYAICSRALLACEDAPDPPRLDLVVAAYVLKVLAHGGWKPQLGTCVVCGEPDVAYLSAASGGTICSSCVRDVADAERVGSAHVGWLAFLLASTFDDIVACEVDGPTAFWLVGLAHRWATTHLDVRLRALEFLLSMA